MQRIVRVGPKQPWSTLLREDHLRGRERRAAAVKAHRGQDCHGAPVADCGHEAVEIDRIADRPAHRRYGHAFGVVVVAVARAHAPAGLRVGDRLAGPSPCTEQQPKAVRRDRSGPREAGDLRSPRQQARGGSSCCAARGWADASRSRGPARPSAPPSKPGATVDLRTEVACSGCDPRTRANARRTAACSRPPTSTAADAAPGSRRAARAITTAIRPSDARTTRRDIAAEVRESPA